MQACSGIAAKSRACSIIGGMLLRTVLVCALLGMAGPAVPRQPPAAQTDGVDRLVAALQSAIESGDGAAIRDLVTPDARAAVIGAFIDSIASPKVSRVSIKLRDRLPATDGHARLILEILAEHAAEASVSTWRVDAAPGADAAAPWRIAGLERLTIVYGLYQLALDGATEYAVHSVTIRAPDLTLTIRSGRAFVARSADGVTAMVFLGRGRTEFSPKPAAERGQVRIFCGADSLRADFDALYIRLNPGDYDRTVSGTLTPRALDPSDLRRATQLFDAYVSKSFAIDLGDMSTAQWSLVPPAGDFIAEIDMRKFGALTYARDTSGPEDVSLFDRRRRINISVYASEAKLESRGRFYSEDADADYDITHYDIEAAFAPDRSEIIGRATVTLRLRARSVSTISLHLADSLVVQSVTSQAFGRLFFLRVPGQHVLLIGFAGTVVGGTQLQLTIRYSGHIKPQSIETEAVRLQPHDRQQQDQPEIVVQPEPDYLYSNRAYWYPQGLVTGYATARLSITVPADLDVVASGVQQGAPQIIAGAPGERQGKRFLFEAKTPEPYIACLISRFLPGAASTVSFEDPASAVAVQVVANPREVYRARQTLDKTADILKFYASLVRDVPYDHFTVALAEANLPGGHSPAYFSLVNEPLPTSPFSWANDPVAFPGYPSFFLAHEIAHEWWGQAIGWKNYHEQWISEGFAQYFAALYAGREHGPAAFGDVLRQMQRWAINASPQGPVYLGYRLGHIKNNSRVFRALVYNKGAMVLHMLRRLLGDEAFFAGLRDFYRTWRFHKAGTDDLRAAMEKASGLSLERFFETWIYGSAIPRARFVWAVDPNAPRLDVEFDQEGETVAEFPVTVTITYAGGTTQDAVIAVTDRTARQSIPLRGTVRSVEANRDGGSLVEIVK